VDTALARPITWRTVCEFLERLPGAEQDEPLGREVVRVRGKVVAYPATNDRSRPPGADPDEEFLVLKIDRTEREALLRSDPETYFVTPHYRTYPGVIVRLATVPPDQLGELLVEAWRMVAPKRLVAELNRTLPGSDGDA
jgi:hypothetical protein